MAGRALLVVGAGAGIAGLAQAQPAERARIPIRHGFYAQEQWPCATAPNFFRFDGERMGWIFSDGGDNFSVPLGVEREADGRYSVSIRAIDVDPAERPDARMEFRLRPLADGRVAIRLYEERIYRLCSPAELPRWARRR